MTVKIPTRLLPLDGRFGAGPSRIPKSHLHALPDSKLVGTSHRQEPVKNLVGFIREALDELLDLPTGYEVVLGNGGATAFWDIATACLVQSRAAHGVFGAFGQKFAESTTTAPHLTESAVVQAVPGSCAIPDPAEKGETPWSQKLPTDAECDLYAWPHHETSTGVMAPVFRPHSLRDTDLVVVDATSIAGAVTVDLKGIDVYFFSPQKALASEGGLWIAILSPRALQRVAQVKQAGNRWIPKFLDLQVAINNSRKNQTLNTPALLTLELLAAQLQWMADQGGTQAIERSCRQSTQILYNWAEESTVAQPFVTSPQLRSPVVVTVDFTGVNATKLAGILRDNGIVDVDPYRELNRNQLRISAFPATPAEDIDRLTQCLDYLIEAGVGREND